MCDKLYVALHAYTHPAEEKASWFRRIDSKAH